MGVGLYVKAGTFLAVKGPLTKTVMVQVNKCPKCGNVGSSIFCPKCGTAIASVKEPKTEKCSLWNLLNDAGLTDDFYELTDDLIVPNFKNKAVITVENGEFETLPERNESAYDPLVKYLNEKGIAYEFKYGVCSYWC